MTIRTLQKKIYRLNKNNSKKISEIFHIPEEKIEFYDDILFLVKEGKKFLEEEIVENKNEVEEIKFDTDNEILKNMEEYIKIVHGGR